MEGEATRLCIYFEFADMGDYEVPDTIVDFVDNVYKEHGLFPERIDDYNIYSEYFPDSETNMAAVDEIEARFEERFSEQYIDRGTVSGDRYDIPPGAYQIWISINDLPESLEDEAKASSDKGDNGEQSQKVPSEDNGSVDIDEARENRRKRSESDSPPEWRSFVTDEDA